MRELPDSVVRAKGILWLAGDDGPERQVLQRVGPRWTLRRAPGGAQPDTDRSRLVVIGLRGSISQDWLTDQLAR